MVECEDMMILVGETQTDFCGGKLFLVEVASDFSSVLASITTPWGSSDTYIEITKGQTKTYVNNGNTYTIQITDLWYQFERYVCKYNVCYEEATKGTIHFKSNPIGAEVWVNNDYYGTTNFTLENVNPGTHTVVFKKAGYEDYTTSVSVTAGDVYNIIANLTPITTTGTLNCTSNPSGAEIWINGDYYGVTSVTLENMNPGIYDVTFKLAGYEDCIKGVSVTAGGIATIHCTLAEVPQKATLKFSTNPVGAEVWLNNDYYGMTNFTLDNVNPGTYDVEFIKEGYEKYTTVVSVVANDSKHVYTTLVELPTTGTLNCTSNPSGAEIWINGDYYGVTSVTLENMNPGIYDVTFKLAGYEDCIKGVSVTAGGIATIHCTLAEISTGSINCETYDSVTNAELSCTIRINGVTIVPMTPYVETELEAGSYTITYMLDGYETQDVVVEVTADTVVSATAYMVETTEELTFTSLIIGVIPATIGVGQSSTISGGLHVEGAGLILPGIPVKLYVDKGLGFVNIATPNTPADGTGQFEYFYDATTEDAGKTLLFKWVYEGSETLLLAASESTTRELTVEEEPILTETTLSLSANPNINVVPTTVVQLTAYLTDIDNNPLPDGSFVNFYKGDSLIITAGTKNGYAYCNYKSVVGDSEQTLTFNAKYLGVDNKYAASIATTNVTFKEYIPIKECPQHLTEVECEANDCYWHSDNTCQDAPEGTTEYFDVYIKPYSWFNGKYEQAVSEAVAKTADLSGAINNYISGITEYEYIGIDILEDKNKNIIIVRVYLKDTGTVVLVPPLIIGAIVGIVTGICILSIGYIIGASETEYTKEEVVQLIDDASDKAIEACKERYPNRTTDVLEAANYKHCVGGIETVRIIGAADVVDKDSSTHIDYVIDPKIIELDAALDDGTLSPEDIDVAVETEITKPTKEVVGDYKDIAIEDNCVFDIAGKCIITKKALDTAILIGAGIAGIYALSIVKDVTKK